MSRREHLDRFYQLMDDLRDRMGGYRYLGQVDGRSGWPERGVYFFFEPGEEREQGRGPRVVRVGTHAVSEGSGSTLWERLVQHKGREAGRHAGGGKHRGSIFRYHVGTALLNRGGYPEAIKETWPQRDLRGSAEVRELEHPLEVAVSQYIRSMPFLWVEVPDAPSKESDRSVIEANAVALLSNRGKPPIDPASPGWIGHQADRPAVRESGLWNVDYVDNDYAPGFLDVLARYVRAMGD